MTQLLKYDTNHGRFPGDVSRTADGFLADGEHVRFLAERDAGEYRVEGAGKALDVVGAGVDRLFQNAGTDRGMVKRLAEKSSVAGRDEHAVPSRALPSQLACQRHAGAVARAITADGVCATTWAW